MPRERAARRSLVSRVFLISGLPEAERTLLAKYIQKLGGVYLRSDSFKNNATHVVCGKLTRSEKFLGAVALGRWVVKPDYIRESHDAGKWLDEVSFEWSVLGPQKDQSLAAAAKRARWRASTTTEKIFQDWHVAVVLQDTSRQTVYKRLLAYGGAKVYDIKLPVTPSTALGDSLSYLFTDAELAPLTHQLQQWGILCLNADFISDYLILDPSPDPMDYAFLANDGRQPTHSHRDSEASLIESVSGDSSTFASNGVTSAILLSPKEHDDDFLVLTQAGGEGEQEAGMKQCPVILSPISTRQPPKMETTKAATTQNHSVDKVKTINASSRKCCQGNSSDQVILADVKREMEDLKRDVSKIKKSSLLGCTTQRSLKDWFSPKGKENGQGLKKIPNKVHASNSSGLPGCLSRVPEICEISEDMRDHAEIPDSSTNHIRKIHDGQSTDEIIEVITIDDSQSEEDSVMEVDNDDAVNSTCGRFDFDRKVPQQKLIVIPAGSTQTKNKTGERKTEQKAFKSLLVSDKSPSAQVTSLDTKTHSPGKRQSPGKRRRRRQRVQTDKMRNFMETLQLHAEKRRKSADAQLSATNDLRVANGSEAAHGDVKVAEKKNDVVSSSIVSETNHTGNPELPQELALKLLSNKVVNADCELEDVTRTDARLNTVLEPTCTEMRKTAEALLKTITKASSSDVNKTVCRVKKSSETVTNKSKRASRKRTYKERMSDASNEQEIKIAENIGSESALKSKSPHKLDEDVKQPRGRTVRGISRLLALQAHREELAEKDSMISTAITRREMQPMVNSKANSKFTQGSSEFDISSKADTDLNKGSKKRKVEWQLNTVQELTADGIISSAMSEVGKPELLSKEETSFLTTDPAKVFPIFSQLQAAAASQKKLIQKAKNALRMKPVRRKGPFTQARWQLSTIPVPGGWVLDSAGVLGSLDLGSQVMPEAMNMVVGTSIDEGYYDAAVTTAMSLNFSCPSAEMVGHMVKVLQEADDKRIVYQAYSILMKWLDLYPPISSSHRKMYEDGLQLSDWEFVKQMFEKAAGSSDLCQTVLDEKKGHGHQTGQGHHLLLMFLVAVLERNFLHFLHNVSRQAVHTCLVVRCLWHPSFQVYPNTRTRHLLQYLESAVKARNSPQACWESVLRVVAMAAQCCQLVGCGWRWDARGVVDQACSAFIRDVASAISAGCAEGSRVVQLVAQVHCPWLQRELVGALLAELDDYLVPGGLTTEPVTLKKIVSQYFFLLPRLSEEVLKHSDSVSANKNRRESAEDDAEEKEVLPVPSKMQAEKINKRNNKGETMLHRAAMKNDALLLKQLLAVPGVDVNAKDHAGWTPLHEACNHGSMECVKVLLKFTPGKTIDTFFQPGLTARRVDIHATNSEGITPLHDAVICNRMDVVKLLLKYGGSSLLSAKTALGFTPLDLAGTEGMKQVLLSTSSDNSFSQESSQELNSHGPTSFMYNEVVSNGDSQLAATCEACGKFLAMLTTLLRSQLKVMQLQHQEQQQQQHKQQHQPTEPSGVQPQQLKEAAKRLHRHFRKLTTNSTYERLHFQLALVESVLDEYSQYL